MLNHQNNLTPITLKTTLENAHKWLNIIRYGESGTVIQPQDDCEYRVLEIINNSKILKEVLGQYYKKYLIVYIPIDGKDFITTIRENLIGLCLDRKINSYNKLIKFTTSEIISLIAQKGYDIGLFISHIGGILKSQNYQPLIELELIIRKNKNLSVIVFSEIDITTPKYNMLADKSSFLFDNLIYYPLYDENDARQFLKYYYSQWNFHLPEKYNSRIIDKCGGYLWLIHQAARNLRNNKDLSLDDALSNELICKKLEVIWNKFSNAEKDIIRKVIFDNLDKKDKLSHEYKFLQSIRILEEKKGESHLTIPLLKFPIEKENQLSGLNINNNRIYLGHKDITLLLTRKERIILSLLFVSKKKIIPRDLIAQTLWGRDWEEKYSDWAIDRLAHRIRKKFKTLGIDEKLLKTVKKKGFIFG